MSTRDKYLISGLLLFAFGYFLNAISSILLPFVMGVVIAYLLDPLADKMEKKGISRWIASAFIVVSFFAILVIAITSLLPILYKQAVSLVVQIPNYVEYINEKLIPYIDSIITRFNNGGNGSTLHLIDQHLSSSSKQIANLIAEIVNDVWVSSLALINVISLLSITPITAYYILNDWDKVKSTLEGGLPIKYKYQIKRLWNEIDVVLSSYIRGQVIICSILAAYYTISLVSIGLDYSIFVGIATGLVSFIPYIGPIFGACAGGLVAFFQWGDLISILVVVGIFAVGQFIEGYFITPKLMSQKLNVHPVWIIFGLFAGGALAGFWGMLLAVPVTAIVKVIIRRIFLIYKRKYVDIEIEGLKTNPEVININDN